MLVDALIQAHCFVVPGKTSENPAIVVNMGTLGIRTLEKESRSKILSSITGKKTLGNYSNYALSLDGLGMYNAPNEKVATSCSRDHCSEDSPLEVSIEQESESDLDTKLVERLITQLSMRFIVFD